MKRLLHYSTLLLLLVLLPSSLSAEVVGSGSCGDNLVWSYNDETHELKIEGKGSMKNYSYYGPWRSYESEIAAISLPSGLTNIGNYAFSNCSSLASITIPSSVTSIGDYAFRNCSSLASITIPSSVTSIGNSAFNQCYCSSSNVHNNSSINLEKSGLTICDVEQTDGLMIKNNEVIKCRKWATSITIPSSVTSIRSSAFYGCSSLTSVTIPEGVTSIGDYAFKDCSSLASITIDSRLPWIGYHAFERCYCISSNFHNNSSLDLTDFSLTICDMEQTDGLLIKDNVAVHCRSWASSITIPEDVTSIGSYAFYECSSLSSITIPESVTSIGYRAFESCSSLASITIPGSITSIGESAFSSCSSLVSITIPEGVTNIERSTFFCCSSLASITISEGVTSIGDYAFQDCSSLASITIPKSVTSIGFCFIEGCSSLTDVTCLATTPPTGTCSFSSTLHVLPGCGDAYLATGKWGNCTIVEDAVDPIVNGTCGENLAWTLYDDGNLVIEGTGAMNDYSISTAPWYSYRSDIKEVQITQGVTSIGSYAFYECSSLTSVTIPEGVTSIGNWAFGNCSSLTSVTIPNSVTDIGEDAFYECSSLSSITIPDGVKRIGVGAFEGCSSLTSITIPESVTYIGFSPFSGCSSLISINVAPNNTYYTSLDGVLFNKAITRIVQYPAAKQQASYAIPNGVTSIGYSAFWGCSSLTSITIPEGVTSIVHHAFNGCSSIASIAIPEGVTSIGNYAFEGCSSLTSITIPESVTSIGASAFNGTAWYDNQPDGLVYAGLVAYKYKGTMPTNTSIVLKEGSTGIAGSAFWGCSSLTSITIPSSVTSIGYNTFSGCSSLTDVTIPNSVTSIGNYAFYGCSSLTSITIPSSVTSIGEYAFKDCSDLTDVTNLATTPPSISSSTFSTYGTLHVLPGCGDAYRAADYWSNFTIVEDAVDPIVNGTCGENLAWTLDTRTGVLKIEGGGAMNDYSYRTAPWYSYCSDIKEVQIAEGVTSIGNYAFQGCSSLTSITIPEGVTSIGYNAFYGCSSLTSVNIPSSVTSIANNAFYGCSSLTSITIPCSVTSIGSSAFRYCSSLTSINVAPNNTYYTSLDGVLFDKAMTQLVQYPTGKQQVSYTIPSSVTSIGSYAFYNCSSLTSITIPASVTSIGSSAFYNCSSLTSVNISNIAAWCDINFQDVYANPLGSAHHLIVNGEEVKDLVIPEGVTSIEGRAFRYCSSLTSITIPEGVTSIGDGAFYNCSYLTSISIPKSVTSIGREAFSNCSRLPVVDNIRYADTYLIGVVDKTCTSANIKEGTRFIGSNAFENCSDLVNVTIPSSVINVGYCAFRRCTGLTSIEIPMGVTSLEEGAFSRCTNLTDVYIPSSVTNIGDYAFDYCSSLTSIIIPEGVANIGLNAFDSCSGLTDVTSLATTPPSISSSTFSTHGTLHVLPGCGDAYRAAYNWSNFTIVEDAVDPIIHGTCGENLAWTLDTRTGVLKIEGAGAMSDFWCNYLNGSSITTAPWGNYYQALKSVIISQGVTSIGSYAFYGCSSLTSVTIPDSVTSIGNDAFYRCSSLTSINIPASVTSIGSSAFSSCSSLTSINVAPNNTYYTSLDGVLFDKAMTQIVQCPAGKQQVSYTIPEGVTSIGSSAFSSCSSLTSITIPESVTSIGDYAFSGCSSLTSITIPESVTSIGASAFNGTAWYDNQPDGLVYAGLVAYGYKGTMPANTNIILEDGTKGIATSAFSYCFSLTSVTIPESVTSIGSSAFYNCSSLTSINIPASVTSIGSSAFYNCSSLTSINIPASVTSIGSSAFSSCSSLTSITISDGVTSIGNDAFYRCSSLTSINIPASVTSIGSYAFNGCSGLTDVTSLATTPPSISSSTTFSTYGTLHVLPGCGDAYRAADYWSNFTIVEDAVDPNATYSLTFMVDDEQHHTASLKMGEEITLPEAPTKDGYTFKGWEGLPEDMLMPASDLTLVAVFEIILGDANGDNEIDVADLSAIASYILGHPGESFIERAADMNNDNEIDVADISALAYLILHPETAQKAKARKVAEKKENIENAANTLYAEMLQAEAGTDVVLPIMMRNTIEATGFQLDLVLPEGVTLEEAALSNARTSSKRTNLFDYARQADGTYRILCNSTKGLSFNGHDGEVMILTLHIDKDAELGAQTISLKDMVLTDATGTLREESSLSESTLWVGNATSIHEMASEKSTPTYDLQGRQVSKKQKGIVISDGKKIMKK